MRWFEHIPIIGRACNEKYYLNTAAFIADMFYTEDRVVYFWRGIFLGLVLSLLSFLFLGWFL